MTLDHITNGAVATLDAFPVTERAEGGRRLRLSQFPHRSLEILRSLLEASEYALSLDRSAWDFAVGIEEILAAGPTKNDLRWLVCGGFIDHAREVTEPGQDIRTFEQPGGLVFQRESCFILTDAGEATAKEIALSAMTLAPDLRVPASPPEEPAAALPKWDRDRQQLRFGKLIVKQFKAPAVNQETILAAFEEEGWPVHIDDPLRPHPDLDAKRRLHDTINALNRNQIHSLIRFCGDGRGQGVRWESTPSCSRTNGQAARV